MKRVVSALIGAGALVVGVLLGQLGLLEVGGLHLGRPHIGSPGRTEVRVEVPSGARIVAIEPVSLDCRARVHARVPVEAVRRHSVFGQVYRTDRVTLDAVGDVDTCVDGAGATISRAGDGAVSVTVDASAVTFVRPRVDAAATAGSLTEHEGQVGKLTDVLPWVDDNLGLTPLAYAYAQDVIGGSRCMEAAYSVTEDLLRDAYRRQAVAQGADPALVTVTITGRPAFGDPAAEGAAAPAGVELRTGAAEPTCTVGDPAVTAVAQAVPAA